MNATTTEGYSLTIDRQLAAPREDVFNAWTTAAALARWFSPSDDFRVEVLALDVRVGGEYRIRMHEDDGVHTVYGEYVEINRPDRLVFTWAWEHSDDDAQMLVTIDLSEEHGGTRLSLLHERLPSENARDLHNEGWSGCLDRLGRAVE